MNSLGQERGKAQRGVWHKHPKGGEMSFFFCERNSVTTIPMLVKSYASQVWHPTLIPEFRRQRERGREGISEFEASLSSRAAKT